jgi:hypothetical protein
MTLSRRAWMGGPATLLGATIVVATPASAQVAAADALSAPYSQEELMVLVSGPLSADRVALLVENGCLSFEPDSFDLLDLRGAGAEPDLLRRIGDACRDIDPESPGATVPDATTGRGSVVPGSSVAGRFSSSDLSQLPEVPRTGRYLHVWNLAGVAGQSVTIDMQSSSVDPYLVVTGPGLSSPLTNDDGGGGTNARVTLRFRETGSYQVIASTYAERDVGDYTLSVSTIGGGAAGTADVRRGTEGGFYGSESWLRFHYGSRDETRNGGMSWATMTASFVEIGLFTAGSRTLFAASGTDFEFWELDAGMSLNLFLLQPNARQPFGLYGGGLASFGRAFASGAFDEGINRYAYGWEAGGFARVDLGMVGLLPRVAIRGTKHKFLSDLIAEAVSARTTIVGVELQLGGFVPGVFLHSAEGVTQAFAGLTFSF